MFGKEKLEAEVNLLKEQINDLNRQFEITKTDLEIYKASYGRISDQRAKDSYELNTLKEQLSKTEKALALERADVKTWWVMREDYTMVSVDGAEIISERGNDNFLKVCIYNKSGSLVGEWVRVRSVTLQQS